MKTLQVISVLTFARSIGNSQDRLSYFLMGAIIGFLIGTVGLAGVRYIIICIQDWRRKKKEAVFKLGKNIRTKSTPKLISLDDD